MKNKNLFYIILCLLILTGCKFNSKPQKTPLKYELVTINCRVPEYEPEGNRKLIVPKTLEANDITQLIFSGEFIFDEGYSLDDFSDEEKKYFSFTQTYNPENGKTAIELLQYEDFELAKGNWNFKLEAKTTGPENTLQTAAIGEKNNLIIEAKTEITFQMQKVNSGDGYYSANISFPKDGADKVLYKVIPSDKTLADFTVDDFAVIENFSENANKNYFIIEDKQISCGLYYLYLLFYKNNLHISVNTVYFQVVPGHKTEIEQSYDEINTPYTITYVMQSDSDETNKPQWNNNSSNVTYTFNSSMNITLPGKDDITRNNYVFEGWYDNSEFTGSPITGWLVGEQKGDITLYAKWKLVVKGKIEVDFRDIIEFSLSTDIASLEEDTTINIITTNNGTKITDYTDYNFNAYVYLDGQKIIDSSSNDSNKKDNSYVKYDNVNKSLTFKQSFLPEPQPLNFIVSVSAKYNGQLYSANMGVDCIKWYIYEKTGDLTGLSGEVYVKVIGDTELPSVDECNTIDGSLILDLSDSTADYNAIYFGYCTKLKKVILPKGLKRTSDSAFEDCTNLTSVIIPEGVKKLESYTFYHCPNLTSITIPESVTELGISLFEGCENLTSVNIPEGVESIGNSTFHGCKSLTSITIPESVKTIDEYAFVDCENLTSINIPENVESIGQSAFENCKSLTNITIPDSVTSIKNKTFSNCTNLTSVNIPENVESIGQAAFKYCSSLICIIIPDSVTNIGSSAFENCNNLTSITLPKNLNRIESNTFLQCTNLTSINIPESVTVIGSFAFDSCSSLTSIIIPDSVTIFGAYTFEYCTKLTSINIPKNVKNIGAGAFTGCSNLSSATVSEDQNWTVNSNTIILEKDNPSGNATKLKNNTSQWNRQ